MKKSLMWHNKCFGEEERLRLRNVRKTLRKLRQSRDHLECISVAVLKNGWERRKSIISGPIRAVGELEMKVWMRVEQSQRFSLLCHVKITNLVENFCHQSDLMNFSFVDFSRAKQSRTILHVWNNISGIIVAHLVPFRASFETLSDGRKPERKRI
jgi:hypothetical protein